MTDLTAFNFQGHGVRVVADEHGEPWFVAKDVLAILDLNRSSLVALDDDEKGVHSVYSPGGDQNVTIVSEPGLYSLILRSRKNEAKAFKRWLLRDVLPSIRRTGSYGTPALTGPALMAAALIEAQAVLEARETEVRELTPRAEAWDALAATDGDYSMRDAAQILCRDHGVDIGQNRLSKRLREIGWVDPQGIPYQRHVDLGRLRSRARYYTHARTQERVLAEPQIRITPKGVADLRTILATKEIA